MRSAARLRTHPLHPILLPFPLAFLLGAVAFDLAGSLAGRDAWWHTGRHLLVMGLFTALAAAVPGFIDYRNTVPPRSSGRRRASWHMATNLSAVSLFAIGWAVRADAPAPPGGTALALELAGAALLVIGSWMGGTLVTRNLIGVDHRYARSGAWRELRAETSGPEPLAVARPGELEVDQMKLVRVNGRRVVVARTRHGYVGFDDRCTHRGGSLAGGVLIGGVVQCLWHGSQFDAATGQVRCGPAGDPIRTYRVEEANGQVWLFPG